MKAMIILDDLKKIDLLTADIRIRFNDDIVGVYKDVELIPIHTPIKINQYMHRQYMIAEGLQNEDGSVPMFSKDYENGWNDCLDEILGEEVKEEKENE